MDLELKDKVVLISGGTRGIGLACARIFVAEGARVGVTSRSQSNIDAALAATGAAFGHAADLSDEGQAAAMIDAMQTALGPVDILVNCAGATKRRPPEDLTPATYRAAMEAKYYPYMNVIDPLIKAMAARGAGVIINVIGNGGRVASPIHLAGGAANAALMLVTAGLAHTYAPRGVRVLGLNPALTRTDRVADGLKADAVRFGITEEEAFDRSQRSIPLGRMAEPDEIASVVIFAASARASYLTGTNITMDGATFPTVT